MFGGWDRVKYGCLFILSNIEITLCCLLDFPVSLFEVDQVSYDRVADGGKLAAETGMPGFHAGYIGFKPVKRTQKAIQLLRSRVALA